MNNTVVTNVGNRNICFLNDKNISFYINMPNTDVKNVSIAINILDRMDSINLNISSGALVSEEIKKLYVNFNHDDIVLVIPVLDNNIVEQLKLNNNEKIFIYTDKYISYLINQVYSFLSKSNITVNSVIKLNNNATYKVFNEWFVNKYNGRVELFDFNKTDVPSGLNPFEGNVSVREMNEDMSIANQVLDSTSDIDTIRDESVLPENNVREPGFVSYVLLGVIVVVISLVILYMLL